MSVVPADYFEEYGIPEPEGLERDEWGQFVIPPDRENEVLLLTSAVEEKRNREAQEAADRAAAARGTKRESIDWRHYIRPGLKAKEEADGDDLGNAAERSQA